MKKNLFVPLVGVVTTVAIVLLWQFSAGDHANNPASPESFSDQTSIAHAAEQESPGGEPTISFPESSHNFGAVPRGAKLTHDFVVRNTGDAPLRILKAKAG